MAKICNPERGVLNINHLCQADRTSPSSELWKVNACCLNYQVGSTHDPRGMRCSGQRCSLSLAVGAAACYILRCETYLTGLISIEVVSPHSRQDVQLSLGWKESLSWYTPHTEPFAHWAVSASGDTVSRMQWTRRRGTTALVQLWLAANIPKW